MKKLILIVLGLVIGALVAAPISSSFAIKQAQNVSAESATLFVGYLGFSVTIIATLIALWGVYSQRLITRRQATMHHLFSMKADATIQSNIRCLIEAGRDEKNLAQWADKDNIDKPQTLAIIAVLNDYELLSTGIQSGIYDYDIVKQYDASTIKMIWMKTHPYIVALRARHSIPTLWKEFELLHDWISGSKSPTLKLLFKAIT